MKFLSAFVLGLILLSPLFAQENVIELRNEDVLSMIAAKVPADVIIKRIETSRCYFDTFPPVISELRYKGVSEEILIAMVAAPVGRATRKENTRSESPQKSPSTVPATEKSEPVTSDTQANAVSAAKTDKKPSDSATSATVTNAVSPAKTDKKPSDSATSARVTNVVSPAKTDKKPSDSATSATVTNAVSPAKTDKKPSDSATNATVTNAVSATKTDKKPSDSAISAAVTNAVSATKTDKKPSDSAISAAVANTVAPAQTDKKPSDSAVVQNKSTGPAASSQAVAATEVLTNDDLIKLLKGGTPSPDIVKRVKSAKGNYDFSGKALFALQQAGADASIFLSMMEVSRAVQNEQKERDGQNLPSKPSKP